MFYFLQLRTLNSVAQLDTLQEVLTEKITSMGNEYGAKAELLTQELEENLNKTKRQKRLGVGRLAEAIFYLIRTRHQAVRDSYITKNLTKLVGFNTQNNHFHGMLQITMK